MQKTANSSSRRLVLSVFGSANPAFDASYTDAVNVLGSQLADLPLDIQMGATSGLMGEFVRGIHQQQQRQAHTCLVVYDDKRYLSDVVTDELCIKDSYFSRLERLCGADVFLVFDGQLGTMAETMVVWNRLQATREFRSKIMVFGHHEQQKIGFLRDRLVFSRPEYRQFIHLVDSGDAVIAQIRATQSTFLRDCLS